MKSYEEMAKSVLERRDAYREEQKIRCRAAVRAGGTMLALALVVGGIFLWQRPSSGSGTVANQAAEAVSDLVPAQNDRTEIKTASSAALPGTDAMTNEAPRSESVAAAEGSEARTDIMTTNSAPVPTSTEGSEVVTDNKTTSSEDVPFSADALARRLKEIGNGEKLIRYQSEEEMRASVKLLEENWIVLETKVNAGKIGEVNALVFRASGEWYSLSREGASAEELLAVLKNSLEVSDDIR